MSIKSRLDLLKKIQKSAQVTDKAETVTQDTSAQGEQAAWKLFDQLFDQVFTEEVSKLGQ